MSLLDVCRRTARRTFGIERLRPEQESAMVAVLEGHDALVALPTGFGKSLIYQVPAMILERPTIVVWPLIALMADQERALRGCGVPVVVLHSRLRLAERRAALEQLEGGGRLVVLTTPETLEFARHCALFRPRSTGAPLRGRGSLHLGVGARLQTVVLAARRRPRAAGQPAGARTHGDRDAACPRGYRQTASPTRSGCAHCSGSPKEPSLDRRNRARSAEVRAPPADASGRCAGPASSTAPLRSRSISSRAPSSERASRSCGITARCAPPIELRPSVSSCSRLDA